MTKTYGSNRWLIEREIRVWQSLSGDPVGLWLPAECVEGVDERIEVWGCCKKINSSKPFKRLKRFV